MNTRHHEVPTHLNVEDRIMLGLTVRQLLYLLVGSSAVYTLWEQTAGLAGPVHVALAALSGAVTLGFALLRPAGRGLEEWLVVALVYCATARQAVWRPREPAPADWRLAGAGWQELTPSLLWVEVDDGCG